MPGPSRAVLERTGMGPERAYYWEQIAFATLLLPRLAVFRPDVVHVSDPAITNVLVRARASRLSRGRVVFCNGGRLSPEHYARYDHVHLVTPDQADEARAYGIRETRFTVVPLGIDCKRFVVSESVGAIRYALGLPDGLVVIAVGALDDSVKRLGYVIDELGSPGSAAWTLVCLGQRTNETKALERHASDRAPGRVHFHTAAPDDVPRWLRAADAAVLASRSEGFGLAVAEAMAAGLPLVVRDIPSLRHIVGDDAQLDPLLQPGALTRRLEALSDPTLRARLGSQNARRVCAQLDWSSLVPRYLAMYARALGANA